MTKPWRIPSVWMLIVVFGTMTTAAQQQQQTAPAALRPQTPVVDRYVVGKAKPPEVPGSPYLDLTLEQAIQIALEKNLNIQSAKMNPLLQDYALQSTRASFMPRLSGSYSFSDSRSVPERTDDGVDRTIKRGNSGNTGFSQTLPWYGASFSTTFRSGRNTTNIATSAFNPSISSGLDMSFSMPLLRNFKIDNTRNSLRTAPISRLIADVQLQQTISQTTTAVRNAYWSLRQAIEQIEIAKLGLEMSRRQLEDTKLRVEIGSAAPIDVFQPDASVADAELAVLNAEIGWRNQELTLKNLLVGGLDDELYKSTLNPMGSPGIDDQPPNVDIPGAIQTALSQRSDVIIQRRQLEVQELGFEVTKNATLPQLGLTTSYGLSGSGGLNIIRGIESGWGDAVGQIFNFNTPQFALGLNFQYNLGMRAEKANLASAQIRLDQQRLTLKNQELTVQNEITRLGLAVDNAYRQLFAARKAREVAEKNVEAEVTRLDLGLSNAFTVATVQQTLTSRRLTELSRIIAYINAVADFERAQKFPG